MIGSFSIGHEFDSLFQRNLISFGLPEQQFLFATIEEDTAVSWILKAM
jgi:hypothetical protein